MLLVKVIIVDIGEDGKDTPNTTYVIKRQSWVHLWLGLLFTRHKRHGSLPHNSLLQKRGRNAAFRDLLHATLSQLQSLRSSPAICCMTKTTTTKKKRDKKLEQV